MPHSIFESGGALVQPNKLIIRLQPEENIRLLVMAKEPGLDRDGIRLREVPLDLSHTNAFAGLRRRIAYERLLLDFIEGDPTLFVRRDEVEAQWKWIDAIRDGWASGPPAGLRAGTWGPPAASLIERDGRIGMTNVAWRDYDTASEMASAVADHIGLFVEAALDSRGEALVALPGGKSPFPLFERLATANIDWSRVTIIPTDDRLVPVTDLL